MMVFAVCNKLKCAHEEENVCKEGTLGLSSSWHMWVFISVYFVLVLILRNSGMRLLPQSA